MIHKLDAASRRFRKATPPRSQLRLRVEQLEDRTLPATFLVSSVLDGGAGSLRQAILDANGSSGLDTIAFNLGGGGLQTIRPTSALPALTDSVLLDGTTQPGFTSTPLIEIDGSLAGAGVDGLVLTGGSSILRGLIINRFSRNGVVLSTSATNHAVEGCWIGLASNGSSGAGNGTAGILANTNNHRIGGTSAGQGNVISGNAQNGAVLSGNAIVVEGNFIGTNAAGTAAVPNGTSTAGNPAGILATGIGSRIGGTTAAARNVISGNASHGIWALAPGVQTGHAIQGNYIGLNAAGSSAVPNGGNGLLVDGAQSNFIGGSTSGAGNTIAGNTLAGLVLASSGNTIQSNNIGVNGAGSAAVGNGGAGILIRPATAGTSNGNFIGGTGMAPNLISGNGGPGIHVLAGPQITTILGTWIGLNATGNLALPNQIGVLVSGGFVTLGSLTLGTGNVISGNAVAGVILEGDAGNGLIANLVGTTPDGISGLPNQGPGLILRSSNNTIGVVNPGGGNLIAFNTGAGLVVEGGVGNVIRGNAIHSNGGLGIDLSPLGVTANDVGDADVGSNQLQNYPVLNTAITTGGTTTVTGTLASTPLQTFTIDFYASPTADSSGFGEGRTFAGSATVSTDSGGLASFSVPLALVVPVGQVLAATATASSNDTSEFSAAVVVTSGGGNTPPTISNVADRSTSVNTPTGPIAFTVGDAETVPAALLVTASSSNQTLIPDASIVLSGSGANRTVSLSPALNQTGTATITLTVQDGAGATASDTFVLTVLGGTQLVVVSFTPNAGGFKVRFNQAIDPVPLNLYDGLGSGGLGPVDVTLTGQAQGPLRGSLVLDAAGSEVTFLRTADVLGPDNYTVLLRSAANGFRSLTGELLDGDNDGMPGGDYTTGFTIGSSLAVRVGVPDFARGPAQPVNLPAAGVGLPLRLSDGTGIRSVQLTLRYDPGLLAITAAGVAPGLPVGATVMLNTSMAGVAIVTFQSPTDLPAGPLDFVRLTAAVPAAAASRYTAKQVLDVTDVVVMNSASIVPSLDDDGLHINGYPGDANPNGLYSSSDATRILRVALGFDSGFAAYQVADPVVLADINGNQRVDSSDATRILQEAVGIDQATVPPLPGGVSISTPPGADPLLQLPRSIVARPGQVVEVPVLLDISTGLESAELALSYDVRLLELLEVRRGSLTADFDLFMVNGDAEAGTVRISLGRTAGPIDDRGEGTVVGLTFRVRADAPVGPTPLNLRERVGQTSTRLNDGGLTLTPAPSDAAGDPLDSRLLILPEEPKVGAWLSQIRDRVFIDFWSSLAEVASQLEERTRGVGPVRN